MTIVAKHWMRLVAGRGGGAVAVPPSVLLHRFSASRPYHPPLYEAKVGTPDFLNGVENRVEAHVAKLEAEIGDLQHLLVARILRLKKLGIPCKDEIRMMTIDLMKQNMKRISMSMVCN